LPSRSTSKGSSTLSLAMLPYRSSTLYKSLSFRSTVSRSSSRSTSPESSYRSSSTYGSSFSS
jgi:hypothetical protein